MNTLMLLNHIPNPRMMKRAAVLHKCSKLHLACIRRLNMDIWDLNESAFDSVNVIEAVVPSSDRPIARLASMLALFNIAKRVVDEVNPETLYLASLDCLAIGRQLKSSHPNMRLVYEVADIREILLEPRRSLHGRMLQAVVREAEKALIKKVDALVVTSERFYTTRYSSMCPSAELIFAPNAPDTDSLTEVRRKDGGKFVVGFIGVLRYLQQLKMLIDAADQAGVNTLFAGKAISASAQKELELYAVGKAVEFYGKYDYDKEIVQLYSSVDCVYAVYDADNANVRLALPNKLYEAVLCELPIIVARGTYLSELVESWGVGFSVDHRDSSELASVLTLLKDNREVYDSVRACCRKIKEGEAWRSWEEQLMRFVSLSEPAVRDE